MLLITFISFQQLAEISMIYLVDHQSTPCEPLPENDNISTHNVENVYPRMPNHYGNQSKLFQSSYNAVQQIFKILISDEEQEKLWKFLCSSIVPERKRAHHKFEDIIGKTYQIPNANCLSYICYLWLKATGHRMEI